MATTYANNDKGASKVHEIKNAWETLAPSASFSGVDLAGFTAAVAPAFGLRAQIEDLRAQIAGLIAQRDAADKANAELVSRVVSAVKGDAAYGENSALYRAMGYKTRDERKSGLTRNSAPVSAPVAP